ncbi:hypothetical protein, partial [Streptomyces sp. SA3_actF]
MINRHAAHAVRRRPALLAALTAAALGAGLLSAAPALASEPASAGPAVTRAGLDPSLVAGRGARVGFA